MQEQDQRVSKKKSANLVWFISSQSAAEIRIAPCKGFIPGRWDKNFILLHCKDAFICTYYLSHRLFEF